jgi:hypothetical protein
MLDGIVRANGVILARCMDESLGLIRQYEVPVLYGDEKPLTDNRMFVELTKLLYSESVKEMTDSAFDGQALVREAEEEAALIRAKEKADREAEVREERPSCGVCAEPRSEDAEEVEGT